MKKLLHKIAHLLNWNYGDADAFYEGDTLMMSFKCRGCGMRQGIYEVDYKVDLGKKYDPVKHDGFII